MTSVGRRRKIFGENMEKTVENRRELERKWKITREIMTKS
jgi:hypothetical protein